MSTLEQIEKTHQYSNISNKTLRTWIANKDRDYVFLDEEMAKHQKKIDKVSVKLYWMEKLQNDRKMLLDEFGKELSRLMEEEERRGGWAKLSYEPEAHPDPYSS